jgi:hypothetical protein
LEWRKGIDVSTLQTHIEQVGHRLRTITTARRGATADEIDNCLTYLDQVADHLEQHGFVVDALTIDARKPVSARLAVKKESGEVIPGVGTAISLEWQRDFGWSTTTHGAEAPRDGWFHLYADDTASAGVVTEFVLNEVMPKDTRDGRPESPGAPAVAS